jgi:flavodoxin
MKIGIIVYSRTSNTYGVAQRLEKKFTQLGHNTTLLQVSGTDDNQRKSKHVVLKDIPDITPFDVLIFGSPVHALHLSPIMQAYLDHLPTLKNKIVAGFVTQAFPFAFMGGNQAITCLKALTHLKSTTLSASHIIHWFPNSKREKNIDETITKLIAVIK